MFAVGVLLAVAFVLRLWGLLQGYPDFYGHVDEVGVAASIWNFFRSASLEPTEFTYPALYSYLVACGIWATAAMGLLDLPDGGGLIESIAFVSYVDPAWSAVLGRILSAAASTGVVGVLYHLGRRIDGPTLGWTAAAMSAFAVIPVRHAHFALPDSLASLFGAGVLWAAWCIAERGRWRDYLCAGVTVGLLLATKYNGALCALAVVAANGCHYRLRRSLLGIRLWVAGAVSLGTCALASPYLVLAYDKYLGVARYQVSSLDFSLQETSPWWWIARGLATEEFLLGGWMLAGVILAVRRRHAIDVIALAAILPAVLYIGSWTRESLHYLLPYYPFFLLLGAGALVACCRRFTRPHLATLTVLSVTLLPSIWRNAGEAQALTLPDTRALAATWIEAHVPAGSTLAMTWLPYCPRIDLVTVREGIVQYYAARPAWQNQLQNRWSRRPAYRTVNLEAWLRQPVVPESLQGQVDLDDPETRRVFSRGWRSQQSLRAAGVDFLVLPAAVHERYFGNSKPPTSAAARFRYLMNRAYFQGLLDAGQSERLASFPQDEQPSRGSRIDIFRLR